MANLIRHKKVGLAVFSGLVLSISTFSLVFAQTGNPDVSGAKIKPAMIQEKLDSGQSFTTILKVTNISKDQQTFYPEKKDIVSMTETGQPVFSDKPQDQQTDVQSWIVLPSDPLVIPGGATVEVPISINVPKNAGPGGHFGAIFFNTRPAQVNGIGTAVGYEVGTLVNIRISGDILENLQVREFYTDKSIYGKPSVNFTTRVENLGNTLARPSGFIDITDMFGKKVATINVNEQGSGVFPKTIRKFENSWQAGSFAFGRYQAVLSLSYGDESKSTITAAMNFWVLPANIIFPFICVLLLLVLILLISVKLYIRGKINSMRRSTEALRSNLKGASGEVLKQQPSFYRLAVVTVTVLVIILMSLGFLFYLFA